MPFQIADQKFVAAATYGREMNINDYDRNHTFLDPHIGFAAYGDIGRVNGSDTLVVDWYDYQRKRSGQIDNFTAALAYELNEYLSFSVGGKFSWGESEDYQKLDKIGYFDLITQNQHRFSYDTAYQHIEGISEYSSTSFNVGFHFQLKRISVGVKVDLPYDFEREYDYNKTVLDSNGTSNTKVTGKDVAKYPAKYSFGVGFKPVDNLYLAIDYRYSPYSKTDFELANRDTTFAQWVDQHSIHFGLDYQPIDLISLQVGFKSIPQTFTPEGGASKDSGPSAESINFGLGVHTDYGNLHFAYEHRVLKYYDSYFSNTNYNTIKFSNIMVGYSLGI
jgi:long-subunit fatty acid transport protein